jgi:negative regulator of sigma E activity
MSKVPEHMPDIVAEQMSAWLDDELPEAELELLVARLGRSPDARGRLGRYGLVGAALRGGVPAPDACQLAERVRFALEAGQESAVVADPLPVATGRDQRWQDNVVPFAAAATVLLTLFLMATIRNPSLAPGATAQAGRAGMFMPTAVAAESKSLQHFPVQTLLSRQRLTDYLVLHGEYTGTLAVQMADSHIVNDRSYAAAGYKRSGYSAK